MKLWLDAHLSPRLAGWLSETFKITAMPVRDAGLREAGDEEIFFAARKSVDLVITKDSDFVELLGRHGPPPRIIWLTCGNTSEARLKEIFTEQFTNALRLLEDGDDWVEISGQ